MFFLTYLRRRNKARKKITIFFILLKKYKAQEPLELQGYVKIKPGLWDIENT